MTKEIWKDIPGYEGLYQVSNLGNIKSLDRYKIIKAKIKGRILKPGINSQGYYQVALNKNGRTKHVRINRIVAQAFIPNPDNLPQVNHKDGDKTNNRIDNLEWCTCLENMNHSYNIGLRDKEKLKEHMSKVGKSLTNKKGHHIRKVAQYDQNNKLIKIWDSQMDASKSIGITNTSIQNVCTGKGKTAGGFIWKYV